MPRRQKKSFKKNVQAILDSQIEIKDKSVILGYTATVNVTTHNLLDPVLNVQGTTSNEFIGNEVTLKSMTLSLLLRQNGNSNIVRLLIVRARSCPSPTDMFRNLSFPILSPISNAFVKKVYMDRTYILNTGSGQNDDIRMVRRTIDFKNKRVHLQNVGSAAEIFYLVTVHNGAYGLGPRVDALYNVKWSDA